MASYRLKSKVVRMNLIIGHSKIVNFQTDRFGQTADPEKTAPNQNLHCLTFHLPFLDTFPHGMTSLYTFQSDYSKILRSQSR